MCKLKDKLNIQLAISVFLIIVGVVLLFSGFWVAPVGEISNSVLVASGEILTFVGSLMGIDYNYKFKRFRIDKDDKRDIEDEIRKKKVEEE